MKVKNYEVWQGTQKFFFDGKVMIGSKYRNLLCTFLLINISNLLHFIFAAQTQAEVIH